MLDDFGVALADMTPATLSTTAAAIEAGIIEAPIQAMEVLYGTSSALESGGMSVSQAYQAVAPYLPYVGAALAAVSIGFTLSGKMPEETKALYTVADMMSATMLFIPGAQLFSWAPQVLKLFGLLIEEDTPSAQKRWEQSAMESRTVFLQQMARAGTLQDLARIFNIVAGRNYVGPEFLDPAVVERELQGSLFDRTAGGSLANLNMIYLWRVLRRAAPSVDYTSLFPEDIQAVGLIEQAGYARPFYAEGVHPETMQMLADLEGVTLTSPEGTFSPAIPTSKPIWSTPVSTVKYFESPISGEAAGALIAQGYTVTGPGVESLLTYGGIPNVSTELPSAILVETELALANPPVSEADQITQILEARGWVGIVSRDEVAQMLAGTREWY